MGDGNEPTGPHDEPRDAGPVADWRDEAAYPPADASTPLARWHWEFLRRNRFYRRDYERFRALSAGVPHEAAERARIARRHGLDGIMLDFRRPLTELFRSPRDRGAISVVRWETEWAEDEDGRRIERDPDPEEPRGPLVRQHEVAVLFDLRFPVEAQLEHARGRLEREQRRHRERRGNVADYAQYLRIWDADAAGADAQDVAGVLFPDVTPALARRRVAAALESARALVESGYRFV